MRPAPRAAFVATLVALCSAGVGVALASTDTSSATPVATLVPYPESECKAKNPAFKIVGRACVDYAGSTLLADWTFADGQASWHPTGFTNTYTWQVPATIGPGPAGLALALTAEDKTGGRSCPGIGPRGLAVKAGEDPVLTVCADKNKNANASASRTLHLLPPTSDPAYLEIGLGDGPHFFYKYTSGSGGGVPDRCKPRKTSGFAAINEVRVVAVQPDVQAHKAGTPEDCWFPVTRDTVLQQGDEISCDPDGAVTLQFADNSTVVVKNTTQLKIASFFTEGGVVKTEILLKMGEVAAKVHKSEATKSDFRIRSPTDTDSVRDTAFRVFYDPGSRATITSVTEHVVQVDPVKPGAPTVMVPAGKEIEVTPTTVSPVAPIGKAGARGGVNRARASALVLAVVAKRNGPCGIDTPRGGAFGVKPLGTDAWLVSVRVSGKLKGWLSWQVRGSSVTPTNALARKVAAGCR